MGRTVVIGAGIIGLACAYELRRRGEDVVVLDKSEPGAAASAGNAGWITPSLSGPVAAPGIVRQSVKWILRPDSPLYMRPRADAMFLSWLLSFCRHCTERAYQAGLDAVATLNAQTMTLYDALVADGVRFEMRRQGVLFAFLSRTALEHAAADLDRMRSHGYGIARHLTGPEARDLEPILSSAVLGGIVVDEERHVRPESLTAGLVARLVEMRATIRAGLEATGFRTPRASSMVPAQNKSTLSHNTASAGTVRAVTTANGSIEADRFVIAAGAWSADLTRKLGFRLPMQAGKGYSITLLGAAPRIGRPLYLDEARVAVSSFDGAFRLAGTMELSGINTHLDQRRVEAIRRSADRYLVNWRHGSHEDIWVGMRPLTPDGLPVIGAVPGYNNVYLATGHAMLGITLAPATAAALAGLMLEGTSTVDLRPFEPARFVRPRSLLGQK